MGTKSNSLSHTHRDTAAFIEKGDPDFGIESHLGSGAPHINALIPIITHIHIRDHTYIYIYVYYIGEHT